MESLRVLKVGADSIRLIINDSCSKLEPWQIASVTATTVLAGVWLWKFLFQEES
jgi:hypothetical protein